MKGNNSMTRTIKTLAILAFLATPTVLAQGQQKVVPLTPCAKVPQVDIVGRTTTMAFLYIAADPCKEGGEINDMCRMMAEVTYSTCRASCSGSNQQCANQCYDAADITFGNCMKEWNCPIIN
jgi:hypothetical protein